MVEKNGVCNTVYVVFVDIGVVVDLVKHFPISGSFQSSVHTPGLSSLHGRGPNVLACLRRYSRAELLPSVRVFSSSLLG